MSGDQADIPEGYVLVKNEELQTLKKLAKYVESVNSNRNLHREHALNDILSSSSRNYVDSLRNKDDLITRFESTCQNSTLRSKIENVKSNCTKTLKKNLIDIQKKQNTSKKQLKERFEKGSTEFKQAYEKELLKSFQNKTTLNNSLPVEQYACDELLKTYRDCLKDQLLPEMDRMYRDHCHKIDTALKDWAHRYSTVVLKDSPELPPAVSEKLSALQRRINQMSQAGTVLERKVDQTLQRFTDDIGQLTLPVRSAADAVPSAEQQAEESLERGDFQGALNHALVAMNLELLMSVCSRMSVDDVFGDQVPDQPILLALLNQLSHNLVHNVDIKSSYLMEAVQALDLAHEVIANNREVVFNELKKLVEHIDGAKEELSPRDFNKNLKRLRWATQQIIQQLDRDEY